MSLFRKKPPAIKYDPATQQPAVRRSICTGEMTVGFIDRATGRFTDLMRVDGQHELEAVTEIKKKTLYRYLQFLLKEKKIEQDLSYGDMGRPRTLYRWRQV